VARFHEDEDEELLQIIVRVVREIDERTERMMGALQDLQTADDNLATEVDAVLADVVALQGQIADLTGQVAAGVSPAALQPLIDATNAKAAQIAAALAPPAPVPPA
jgi:hypothetical protein